MSGKVEAAREFAVRAHAEQRYGEHPYSYHLDEVAAILKSFGEEAQIAGFLHDVIEDTLENVANDLRRRFGNPVADTVKQFAVNAVTDEVRRVFGDRVARCVLLVTDEPGSDRKERKARTNAKLAQVKGELELALIVKAADRLANLRMSARPGSERMLEKYRQEHSAFRQAAFRPGLCDELWREMDGLFARDEGPGD